MQGPRRSHRNPPFVFLPLLLLLLQALTGPARAQVPDRGRPPLRVAYVTSVQDGAFDHYTIALQVSGNTVDDLEFLLPKWAPGAYRLVGWHTGISGVEARTGNGTPLGVDHPEESTWVVHTGGADAVQFTYRVDADVSKGQDGLPVLNNRHYLWEKGGLLDGPRTWMYLKGHKDLGAMARFELPEGWHIATGLNPTPDPLVYSAEDYNWLIDCPVMMGAPDNLHLWRFESWGVPFTVAYDAAGQEIAFDTDAFVASIERITEYEASIFGGFPFTHYAFLYDNGGGGGLEHLRSTTIGAPATTLESDPNGRWSVTAHEFFHTWNVKRIRPYVLGPFDYQGPNRTENLWVSEGMTDTYTDVTGVRTGLITSVQFYEDVASSIASWMASPAQPYASPARMSWTVWDGRDRNPHGTISYYRQGEVLGIGLDLLIRDATDGQRSLDDVMRVLMKEHGGEFLETSGFRTEDLIRIVDDVAGRDLYDFFEDHVYGTVPPPWKEWFGLAGLEYSQQKERVDGRDVLTVTITEAAGATSRQRRILRGLLEGRRRR